MNIIDKTQEKQQTRKDIIKFLEVNTEFGLNFTVQVQWEYNKYRGISGRKTRLYMSSNGANVMDWLKQRIYLGGKTSSEISFYRKVIPFVMEALGQEVYSWRWNRYAGCSCPCSPGFVANDPSIPHGRNIFVNILGEQEEEIK
jgi:hypothetical protein